MKIAVIIPAAGSGSRFRSDAPEGSSDAAAGFSGRSKLDEDLGGRPVLQRAVELFNKRDEVGAIVVAGPADDAAFAEFKLRHGDKLGLLGVTLCQGGKTHRYETVANALKVVLAQAGDSTHVAVHDAARPCTPPELIDRLFTAAQNHAAVIPAIDAPDTIKRVEAAAVDAAPADPLDAILGGAGKPDLAARPVKETLDRTNLVLVQTPQVFRLDVLKRAYEQADLSSTDDAQLVERLGETVVAVRGDARNIKITRSADLPLARAILGVAGASERAVHKRF